VEKGDYRCYWQSQTERVNKRRENERQKGARVARGARNVFLEKKKKKREGQKKRGKKKGWAARL